MGISVGIKRNKKEFIAVYGTLRKKEFAYGTYLKDQRYIGSGTTLKEFIMFSRGYPMIVDKERKAAEGLIVSLAQVGKVEVDVFEINKGLLQELDYYEGCPTLYYRETVPVFINDEVGVYWCWIYIMDPKRVDVENDKIVFAKDGVLKWSSSEDYFCTVKEIDATFNDIEHELEVDTIFDAIECESESKLEVIGFKSKSTKSTTKEKKDKVYFQKTFLLGVQ